MRRVTLIANPRAGLRRDLPNLLAKMTAILECEGIEASSALTTAPGTAGLVAAQAILAGSDAVFACGGDGTVHEVLQGVVGTPASMGVIPIGTANALARNLRLSSDPLRALAQQIKAKPERIPVGEVVFSGPTSPLSGEPQAASSLPPRRYFTVMAGAGPDGALVHSLLAEQKATMGRAAYYVHAARLYATQPFRPFRIRFRESTFDTWEESLAVSAMSARIADLGGAFGRLTRGSSLQAKTLRLSFLRPPATISLPSWFVFGQLRVHRLNPWLRQVEVEEFECLPIGINQNVHAQVDGEWIGTIPLGVRILPEALNLLFPSGRESGLQ